MKVRHSHKIGRQTYRLIYRSNNKEGRGHSGYADHAERKLYISPSLRKDKNEHDRTVWHEVLHAINWEYGLAIGHHTIERLSIALANYVEDNNLDFVEHQ